MDALQNRILGMGYDPDDAIHHWFSLTYASWLVLPRSVLQSMPKEWQQQMVALLIEFDEACTKHNIDIPPSRVHGKTRAGGAVLKELSDYQRGRRRLWDADA